MMLGELFKLENFTLKYKITLALFMLVFFYSQCQVSFTESAVSHGIDISYVGSTFGGGVSFVDFDNDGWDDISFTSESGEELIFFKNNFRLLPFIGVI